MSGGSTWRGVVRHFVLALRLNFRSPQAVAYGYAMPVFFLVAFGSVFRDDTPALRGEMGQLLAITLLGGACFGLPTTLVAERERGVWRHYRLLPVATPWLVLGSLAARFVIVLSSALLQVVLAHLFYGTPWPARPDLLAAALAAVTVAFLGLGFLIAALADTVPAVQALGQCLFLPMVLIGGVGVPLAALPDWARRLSGFMPGRYAVELLQSGYAELPGRAALLFSGAALAVIGGAALAAGALRFRWESGRRLGRRAVAPLAAALAAWLVVGTVAAGTGRLDDAGAAADFAAITDEQIAQIPFDDLPGDNELVTRLAPPFHGDDDPRRPADFAARLRTWSPARVDDPVQRARNLLSVAAIADITADRREAGIARVVFEELQARSGGAELRRVLAWIALRPAAGSVVTQAGELGLRRHPSEAVVRERCALYARKFLGRLTGRLSD